LGGEVNNLLLPAAVTPLLPSGDLDLPALPRLRSWFDVAGCDGWVIAGTNGEGPSLSFYEKRELFSAAIDLGKSRWSDGALFRTILGISAPAVEDAIASVRMATKAGADGVLLMAPNYFREARWEAVCEWFAKVLQSAEIPVVLYNFPQRTGFDLPAERLAPLQQFDSFAGLKDSSGNAGNLLAYRDALPGKELFVGDERLLPQALKAGWSGSISGVANSIPAWLRAGMSDPVKWEMVLPVIERLRASPQPATHKALLHRVGTLPHPAMKLPLVAVDDVSELLGFIQEKLVEVA
jgi:4-hydroxy-tetrahydrodipicolinate synthase